MTGSKYRSDKDIPLFLKDLSDLVNSGKLKKIGQSTLEKGGELGTVYRGSGLTLVVRPDGSYWTVLETSGTGLDKVIDDYLIPVEKNNEV